MVPTTTHAQIVVSEYLRMLEKDAEADRYPGTVNDLPHAKEAIKASFKVSVEALLATDQMTGEMREYLELAYVSLADYIDPELATLMREYHRAAAELTEITEQPRDRVKTEAWSRLGALSKLAGDIAKNISAEAEQLRAEFRGWISA